MVYVVYQLHTSRLAAQVNSHNGYAMTTAHYCLWYYFLFFLKSFYYYYNSDPNGPNLYDCSLPAQKAPSQNGRQNSSTTFRIISPEQFKTDSEIDKCITSLLIKLINW